MKKNLIEVVMKGTFFFVGELKNGVTVPSGRIAILDLLNSVSGDLEILSKKDFPNSILQFIPDEDSPPIDLCAIKRGKNYWKVFPKGDEDHSVVVSSRIFKKLFIIKPNPKDFKVMITGADTNHNLPKV